MIASAFPIAERSSRDKGLQIPIEIMAGLGGVSVAVDVGFGYVLKGQTVAFVPVERHKNHVQWHFLHCDGKAMEFEWLENQQHKPLPQQEFNKESINTTICFLGWTSDVLNLAGMCIIKCVTLTYVEWSEN